MISAILDHLKEDNDLRRRFSGDVDSKADFISNIMDCMQRDIKRLQKCSDNRPGCVPVSLRYYSMGDLVHPDDLESTLPLYVHVLEASWKAILEGNDPKGNIQIRLRESWAFMATIKEQREASLAIASLLVEESPTVTLYRYLSLLTFPENTTAPFKKIQQMAFIEMASLLYSDVKFGPSRFRRPVKILKKFLTKAYTRRNET